MTAIVHDLTSDTMLLFTKHNGFADKYNVARINLSTATRLAYHLFEDTVNALMLWLNDTYFFHEQVGELYAWYTAVGANNRLADEYYSEVYDPVWIQMSQSIEQHIPGETYLMWKVSRAHDFAILTKGDDYRLVQWHELIDTKKIKPPSRKRQWRAH